MKTWNIDPTHSTLEFKVKHLVISTVTGSFKEFTAQVDTPDDTFSSGTVTFSAQIESIDTGVEQRDNHLKSADFFNAEVFPVMKFEGKLTNQETLVGTLTIKDVTKELTLSVDLGGTSTDFYGNHKAGFEITGKINRKDFGLTWNGITEAGAIVVSDEVKIIANIQLQEVN